MKPSVNYRKKWAAAVVVACFFMVGFPTLGTAQETQILKMDKIRPVPKLEKRRSIRTPQPPEEERESRSEGVPIDGIFPERNEIIIGDGSLKLSPDAVYYVDDRPYRTMPSAFKEGSRVTYWLDEETGLVKGLRLQKDRQPAPNGSKEE